VVNSAQPGDRRAGILRWLGMIRAVKTMVLLIALSLPALADLAAGKRAYMSKDYATALNEFQLLADRG